MKLSVVLATIALAVISAPRANACRPAPPCPPLEKLAGPEVAIAALHSTDRLMRARAAFTLVAERGEALNALKGPFADPKWWSAWANNATARCEVSPVFRALVANDDKHSRALLDELTRFPEFQAQLGNLADIEDELIRASASAPATAAMVRFWRKHLEPTDNTYVNILAGVLTDNGASSAIEVFFDQVGDRRFDFESKRSWLRTSIVPHRHEVTLLRRARKELETPTWPEKLRVALVEALFDYNLDWYGICGGPAPLQKKLSDEATAERASIAKLAGSLKLSARLRAKIMK